MSTPIFSNVISLPYTCYNIKNVYTFIKSFNHFSWFLCPFFYDVSHENEREMIGEYNSSFDMLYFKAVNIFFQVYTILYFLFSLMKFLICTYRTFIILPYLYHTNITTSHNVEFEYIAISPAFGSA